MHSMWWYLLLYHSKLFDYVENLQYMQFHTIATKLLSALFYIKCLESIDRTNPNYYFGIDIVTIYSNPWCPTSENESTMVGIQ